MGDATGWQLNQNGSTLFLKPTQVDAITNMVIITNKRTYYFEMYSKEAEGIDDPELVFATKFNYTDINSQSTSANTGFMDLTGGGVEEKSYVPDPAKNKKGLNLNYTMSGSKEISPLEVFDDGEFTYFKFADINADYPAIFQVLPDGNEALINFRVSDNKYVVVERVTSQFTLRFGNQLACVFNESRPLERVKKKKDNTSFFGIF
jgi:type IV secretion system protein VirB9